MDHDEALKLLKDGPKGVGEWNRRRITGEEIPYLSRADLSHAQLIGADLSETKLFGAQLSGVDLSHAQLIGADLSRADLSRADLSGALIIEADLNHANLSGAQLRGADLSYAQFIGADLSHAQLIGADLSRADLSHADLSGAQLRGALLFSAQLSGAQLRGTDLSHAVCRMTVFANVDLSEANGLESIEHMGSSTVGLDTLFGSKGKISQAFLRGCGVPDPVIVNRFALVKALQPIQFYSYFISHSSQDQKFATRLHSRMVQEKLRVWYAPEGMRGGRKLVEQFDEAIGIHDKLLLVLSEASMAGDWVRYEITRAVTREKKDKRQVLFPIGLSDKKAIMAWSTFDSELGQDLAKVVREYHIPDFSRWKDHDSFKAAFARLLRDLRASEKGRVTSS
jgi:hypothetical protein